MSANNLAAAELIGLLSSFWQPPDEGFWKNLADGSVDEEICHFAGEAGLESLRDLAPSFRTLLPPLPLLQSFYLRCFIGIGTKTALPVESLYKKWTDDPTARLPIAGSTGYLMGDPALHMQYLLNHYNFVIPPDYRMMPDHLVLVLELGAYLIQNKTAGEAQVFLTQHLDWLPAFTEAIDELFFDDEKEKQAQRFYQSALELLKQTLSCQLETYPTLA